MPSLSQALAIHAEHSSSLLTKAATLIRKGKVDTASRFRIPPLTATAKNLLLLAIAGTLAATTWGQASAPASHALPPNRAAFEVASVKPAKSDCSYTTYGGPPGRYRALCTSLWGLIYNAYEVRSFRDLPSGLPAWADNDMFDVEAKANDDTVAAINKLSGEEQLQLTRDMLQSLLADRFQLRVHYQPKLQPVYELVLAKGGSKLTPLPSGQHPAWGTFGHGRFTFRGKSMAEFAHGLSFANTAGRTVVDKTGLLGNYDIDLKWTPDDQQGTPDAGPTLFTAFEEQLGLKLKPAKAPIDTLVIDRVEKLSEN